MNVVNGVNGEWRCRRVKEQQCVLLIRRLMGGFAAMDREKSQPSCQDSILLYWVFKVGPGPCPRAIFWGPKETQNIGT